MSLPLLKLIAAQRLLAETRELLEKDALAASLRGAAENRAETLKLNTDMALRKRRKSRRCRKSLSHDGHQVAASSLLKFAI